MGRNENISYSLWLLILKHHRRSKFDERSHVGHIIVLRRIGNNSTIFFFLKIKKICSGQLYSLFMVMTSGSFHSK